MIRLNVSLPALRLGDSGRGVAREGYCTRPEAARDLMRVHLVSEQGEEEGRLGEVW